MEKSRCPPPLYLLLPLRQMEDKKNKMKRLNIVTLLMAVGILTHLSIMAYALSERTPWDPINLVTERSIHDAQKEKEDQNSKAKIFNRKRFLQYCAARIGGGAQCLGSGSSQLETAFSYFEQHDSHPHQ